MHFLRRLSPVLPSLPSRHFILLLIHILWPSTSYSFRPYPVSLFSHLFSFYITFPSLDSLLPILPFLLLCPFSHYSSSSFLQHFPNLIFHLLFIYLLLCHSYLTSLFNTTFTSPDSLLIFLLLVLSPFSHYPSSSFLLHFTYLTHLFIFFSASYIPFSDFLFHFNTTILSTSSSPSPLLLPCSSSLPLCSVYFFRFLANHWLLLSPPLSLP